MVQEIFTPNVMSMYYGKTRHDCYNYRGFKMLLLVNQTIFNKYVLLGMDIVLVMPATILQSIYYV